ncbi:MAG: hypothetical protein JW982_16710 [Spirochaetes bacterium]|nr:hypothetical protein [Spirochaetota bacterium]
MHFDLNKRKNLYVPVTLNASTPLSTGTSKGNAVTLGTSKGSAVTLSLSKGEPVEGLTFYFLL